MPAIQKTEYDVVIIGGGMVGASLACVLQQGINNHIGSLASVKILLVEASPINSQTSPQQPSFDSRSTVLSYGTVNYLNELGLWQSLVRWAEPIKKIMVTDQGHFGSVRMDHVKQGVDALGYVIENQLLGSVLNKNLLAAENIEIKSSAKVNEIKPFVDGMRVNITQGKKDSWVSASLVVLAEGGRSGLSKHLGIFQRKYDYCQSAIIANICFEEEHDNVAYERFTSKGPLALLPLPKMEGQSRAALVWTHSQTEVETVLALNDDQFLKKLQIEFGSKLGKFIRVGKRASYPLSLIQSEEQIRSGLVLLGNVAHSLHPVAGQGFNLAFRDLMHLADNILSSIKAGRNPGNAANLQKYLRAVNSDQELTVGFSHYMTILFSNDKTLLKSIRKMGLLSVDMLPPFKKLLAQRAMGLDEKKVNVF